ncbi:DNA mismatch repair protein MutS [Synechococcus sp. UW179A]|uniref:DNA mismatch repair protein MutS n=1 Tax=Synechococcus sp. UW179A TaxID=2575510 RepID=UPI000E0FDCFF|nr:DNA mismatch repair protein MutS [Synechococcus sp. UW179A]
MTTASSAIDPWPLLRNSDLGGQRAIRLVVHGRSGGVVPESLIELRRALQQRRQAPVQLEVLTADSPPECPEQASWLVPLLLWPGSHARADVPEIRNRMQREGADVELLPFLGSWQCWWALVAEALQPFATKGSVLVHHPLSSEEADRFLLGLSARMGLPLLSFDYWFDYQKSHPEAHPLMLALAPNRMTEALSEAGSLPPLLDLALIRQGLIDLLAALP